MCVVRFVAHVRARVRRGHERTAKKIGVLLCVCSLCNLGVSIVVAVTNEQRGALLQDLSSERQCATGRPTHARGPHPWPYAIPNLLDPLLDVCI